jgi:hypothetical protein
MDDAVLMANNVAVLSPDPIPTPTTNILLIPLVQCTVITGTNEDWIDGFAFFADEAETQPILLDGIQFEMEMRASPPDYSVVVRGSSVDGTLHVVQHIIEMNILAHQMSIVPPGDYVFDIVAFDGYRHRIIVQGTQCTIFEGVTR